MPARVVLAMSGGVDSSVAAYLLKQQGFEVIGLFMRTGAQYPENGTPARKRGCCSARDAGDARRVADQLDLPYYALDFEEDFERVIDYFADDYLAGRTPNPCVVCNQWIKFGKLWSYGRRLGADFIATGHYAQVVNGEQGPELHRAADSSKDQSYVLFGLNRPLLSRVLLPIGGYAKTAVRALARQAGLAVHDKPDSVEICFVPDGDHAALIRARRPGASMAGRIVDPEGTALAEHDGLERFTVGQRKGLGIAAGERRYVLRVIPGENKVVVGPRDDLFSPGLVASRVNWLTDRPDGPLSCTVRVRYRHTPAPAMVVPLSEGDVRVEFETPQSAITPGQAAVFYDGPRVLGGGWIETPLSFPAGTQAARPGATTCGEGRARPLSDQAPAPPQKPLE